MQRKYLLALIFCLLVPIITLAYFYLPQKAEAAQEQMFFIAARAQSFHLIDNGEQSLFFSSFAIESAGVRSANITLCCTQEKPAGTFCILEHPSAIGFDASGFKRGFEEGLHSFGLEAKKVSASQIQSCTGAAILVPTGVLPVEIKKILQSAQESGSQIIFAGEPSNFSIDSFGQVQKLPKNETLQKTLQHINVVQSGLNSNLFSAGYSLALSKIYAKGASSCSSSRQLVAIPPSQNLTLLTLAAQNISSGHCRLIYEADSADGKHIGKVAQSPKLSKLPPLIGPQEIFTGSFPYYSIWLEPAADSGLAIYATANNFAGNSIRQKVFEGSIRSGWLGGFELRNISRAGYYIVSIEDQFSRVYAKSLLRMKELKIQISSTDGTTYRFRATIDNEPVDAQLATVYLEGSNTSLQYPVSSGSFTVAARPSSQESAFIVELLGVKNRIAFSPQRNPVLSYLLQFGAPALFAALLIFLILRKRPKRKYSLRVPDFSQQQEQQIQISKEDFLRAFALANSHFGWKRFPLDCNELAAGLRILCSSKGAIAPLSRQGIEDALAQMQTAGCVQGHSGFYAPISWGLHIEEAANMRIISNILVQKGCIFTDALQSVTSPLQNSNPISATCPFERVRIQVCPSNFSKLKLKISPTAKDVLAFCSDSQMREFLDFLKSGHAQAARLSLLIKNKRIFLCLSSDLEELL